MEQKRIHKLKVATLLFRGTSDDLLFWVLIDTLFLTTVKGFTFIEVSLTFTVSFWVALLFKRFAYEGIKRMKVGKSLVFSAVLFLAAAILITCGPTLPVVIVGQCLYEIAPDFYDISDILMKELCRQDKKGRDYVESGAFSSTMYSTITLVTAVLVDPLMVVNPYLPMIICIVARAFSLALAIGIYMRTKDIDGIGQSRRVVLKGRFADHSTISYLCMAAVFGAFCSLCISYLKLLLQDNMSFVYDESSVIALYSYCIIATRVVKILGNTSIGGAKIHGVKYSTLGVLLTIGGIVAAVCGLLGVILDGMPAIVMTAAGLLSIYFIFDPMLDVTSYLTIEKLNEDQAIAAIYRRGLLLQLVGAIASTIMTAFIAIESYLGVMIVLVLMSLVALVFGQMGLQYHKLKSWDYVKSWPEETFAHDDSLMVSAALLMLHYGAVQSHKFNPIVLEGQVGEVERIGEYYRRFGYVGRRPYTFNGVYQSFTNGEPSAVYGSHDGEYRWYPVLYVDEEDGVTASYDSGTLFLNDFEDIQEQCVFTLKPKWRVWPVRRPERDDA